MPVEALQCKECRADVPARGALRLRAAASARSRSRYDLSGLDAEPTRRKIQAGPQYDLALRRLPAVRAARRSTALPAGLHAARARADRLAERLGLREVWVKNDAANPTHSFKDRVVTVALAKAQRARLRGRGLRLHRQPGERRGRPRRRRRASSRTCSSRPTSRSRRSSPPASTARTLVAVRGNYDDVNRLCTELSGRARLGLRERERAAVLRRGLEDARASRSPSSSASSCPTGSWRRSPRGSLFTKIARGFDEWREVGLLEGELPTMNGAQAEGCSPVAQAFEAGERRLQAGQAGHDRQVARDRQPGRRPLRARPGAPHAAARSTPSPTTRSATGIRLLAETTGIFTETAGGVTTAVLAQARRARATSTPTSASCWSSPARA